MVCVCAVAMLGAAVPASAQSVAQPRRQPGDGRKLSRRDLRLALEPDARRSSSAASRSTASSAASIDFVEDLGIEKTWFTQLKVVLRPATKHKFRFEYTPIKYDAETVLTRDIIFNGIEFPIAIPIESEITWRAYRFAYEYDFIYRDRGFVGLVLEAKYTDVEAR